MSLTQANTFLAVRLHQLLRKERENVFFSPFSISMAMGMLLSAADGETASEIQVALGYEQAGLKKDNVAVAFEEQMSLLLQPNDSYTLSCANSMLSQKNFQVKEEYKKILAESFKALLLEVDFVKENHKAVNQINAWVKEKTNNMIPSLVQSLDPSTAMILLNAVYFKGTWMQQFRKEETFAQPFYNRGKKDKAKKIEMMHMKDYFPFYEDATFQALQLPYIGNEIAMMILLPREQNGLPKVEAGLSTRFFKELDFKLRKEKVEITLPRFRLEYTKSLVPYFSQLGVKRAFSLGAEFTTATDSPEIAVSEILHKAVIEVNEEGSEAAAATMITMRFAGIVRDPQFIADHPFMFVIHNTRSGLILFMGRVIEL